MTRAEDVAVILLAAGLSRRFGRSDKLLAPFRDKPLIQHSLDLLACFPFGERIAVVRKDAPSLADRLSNAGYRLVVNPDPTRGKGTSIALGVGRISRAQACLIWLADMPCVPTSHLQALLRASAPVVASRHADLNQPPILFHRSHFAALMACGDDEGPRNLVKAAASVPAPAKALRDIDHEIYLAMLDPR